jgi:hypothetical protein
MYDSLPKNQRTFDLDLVGDTTGEQYVGQFTVKCVLDMSGKHALELEKTRLMADYANPSRGLVGIAVSLATVRAKIVEAPAWWKNSDDGAKVMDENIILALYDKCNEMEAEWRKELREKATLAQKEAPKGNEKKES